MVDITFLVYYCTYLSGQFFRRPANFSKRVSFGGTGARLLLPCIRLCGVCVCVCGPLLSVPVLLGRDGQRFPSALVSLVAPYRPILRYYRCDTPYRAILLLREEVSAPPKWCNTPLSFTQAHLCDTPFCNVSRDNCARCPIEQAQKTSAILSLQVSHDMKVHPSTNGAVCAENTVKPRKAPSRHKSIHF